MASVSNPGANEEWPDDEATLMDDDTLLDNLDIGDELTTPPVEVQPRGPNWRLIDNLRDEKILKSAMADLEDYDEF